MRYRPNFIPNLPDVVLRKIFGMLSYKEVCPLEGVCRRWQNIILHTMRKDIHEMTIERLGSYRPSAYQMRAFRRLTINCPADSFDFLGGVLRRSRLSVMKMTADLEFLANIDKIHVKKDDRRKYFSNVEDLWLLIISCSDEVVDRFMNVEDMLFTDLQHLTLQVHLLPKYQQNVGRIVTSFLKRYPKATINLELQAESCELIFAQLRELPSLPLNKIKIICTDFDLPQLRLDRLYTLMKEQQIRAKNVTIRDWSLFADGTTPVSHLPLDTFRISCCMVETVDNLIKSLQMTATQERPKVKKKVIKRKKPVEPVQDEEEKPKKKVKKVVKKKIPFIKKLEIAGQCELRGLQFLQNRAHSELEKRLGTAIPDMAVDCSEIYYCF